MNRTPLIITVAIAAIVGLVFGIFPSLDLDIARLFYEVRDAAGNPFGWQSSPALSLLHGVVLKAGFVVLIPLLLVVAFKLIVPRRPMLIAPRAAVFLIVTMLLGPGLLVNVALKNDWGRPRPSEVVQFGGQYRFMPWWDSHGDCPKNCSFVSGDVSTVAWLLAPAALVPPPLRVFAYGGAIALTVFMAIARMMAGGHFPTDTFFAGVFTYMLIWFLYAWIYRWPQTRLDDKAIEAALERFSGRCSERVNALFGRTTRGGKD